MKEWIFILIVYMVSTCNSISVTYRPSYSLYFGFYSTPTAVISPIIIPANLDTSFLSVTLQSTPPLPACLQAVGGQIIVNSLLSSSCASTGSSYSLTAQITNSSTAMNLEPLQQFTINILPPPPTAFSYGINNDILAYAGCTFINLLQTINGIEVSYSVTPTLPKGLVLDSTLGSIAGTPLYTQSKTIYTITAINAAGSISTVVYITVISFDLEFSPSTTYTFTSNYQDLQPTISFQYTPSTAINVVSVSITPSLPPGLSLSTLNQTNIITGTPSYAGPGIFTGTYTVNASSLTGAYVIKSFNIQIVPLPPSSLFYNLPYSFVCYYGMPIQIYTPSVFGGNPATFNSSGLPQGLIIDSTSGVLSGVITELFTLNSVSLRYVTVTVSNSGGSASFSFYINMNSVSVMYNDDFVLYVNNPSKIIVPLISPPISTFTSFFGFQPFTFQLEDNLQNQASIDAASGQINLATGIILNTTLVVTYSSSLTSPMSISVIAIVLPQPQIQYAVSRILGYVGVPLNTYTPISATGFSSWTVQPSLPLGLIIDSNTGNISGTAASTLTNALFQLSASDAFGNAYTGSFLLSLQTVSIAYNSTCYITSYRSSFMAPIILPSQLSSNNLYFSYDVTRYVLPSGFSLNSTTGVISGTAGLVLNPLATSFVITASLNSNLNISYSTAVNVLMLPQVPSFLSTPYVYESSAVVGGVTWLTFYVNAPVIFPAKPQLKVNTFATKFYIAQVGQTTGLPLGMTFDPISGTISGTPLVTSSYLYTCTVENSVGRTTATMGIQVTVLYVAISKQPVSTTVSQGASATFSVTALSTYEYGITFLWGIVVNGLPLQLLTNQPGSVIVSSGTNSTLILSNIHYVHDKTQIQCVAVSIVGTQTPCNVVTLNVLPGPPTWEVPPTVSGAAIVNSFYLSRPLIAPSYLGSSTGTLVVTWTPPSSNGYVVTNYTMYLRDSTGITFNQIGPYTSIPGAVTIQVATNLQQSMLYYAIVLAQNQAGVSSFSALSAAMTTNPTLPTISTSCQPTPLVQTVNQNDVFQISFCAQGYPTPSVSWSRTDGNGNVKNDMSFGNVASTLCSTPSGMTNYISCLVVVNLNVSSLDYVSKVGDFSGSYQFLATNAAGQVVSQVSTLAFNTPPSLPANGISFAYADNSSSISLYLDASFVLRANQNKSVVLSVSPLGFPASTVIWNFNNVFAGTGLSYTTPILTTDNNGIYSVHLQNPAGSYQASIQVAVSIAPTVAIMSPSNGVYSTFSTGGATFSFNFTGDPAPLLQCYQCLSIKSTLLCDSNVNNWLPIAISSKVGSTFSVQFPQPGQTSISSNSAGLYFCVASNSGGSQSVYFQLNLFKSPIAPVTMQTSSVIPNPITGSLSLTWTLNSNNFNDYISSFLLTACPVAIGTDPLTVQFDNTQICSSSSVTVSSTATLSPTQQGSVSVGADDYLKGYLYFAQVRAVNNAGVGPLDRNQTVNSNYPVWLGSVITPQAISIHITCGSTGTTCTSVNRGVVFNVVCSGTSVPLPQVSLCKSGPNGQCLTSTSFASAVCTVTNKMTQVCTFSSVSSTNTTHTGSYFCLFSNWAQAGNLNPPISSNAVPIVVNTCPAGQQVSGQGCQPCDQQFYKYLPGDDATCLPGCQRGLTLPVTNIINPWDTAIGNNPCYFCPRWQELEFSNGILSCRQCASGEVQDSLSLQCTPCASGFYSLDATSSACLPCPAYGWCPGWDNVFPTGGYWSDIKTNKTAIYPCTAKSAGESTACISPNIFKVFYSITGPISDFQLNISSSLWGYTLLQQQQLLKSFVSSLVTQYSEPVCESGYNGALCSICDTGYSRYGDAGCQLCNSRTARIATLIAIALAMAIFFGIIIWRMLSNYSLEELKRQKFPPPRKSNQILKVSRAPIKTGPPAVVMEHNTNEEEEEEEEEEDVNNSTMRSKETIMLKIFLSHLQIVSLATKFNLQWPSTIQIMFSFLASISTVSDNISAIDCELQFFYPTVPDIYKKNLIFASLPFIVAGVISIYWTFIHNPIVVLRKAQPIPMESIIARIILSIWVMLFFVQSTLSKQAFQLFTCRGLSSSYNAGEIEYLSSDLSQQCYTPSHLGWMLTLGIVSVCIYAFGIPLGSFLILVKNRDHLKSNAITRIKYGFLFEGYTNDCYYWESIIMLRKVSMVAITVFFNSFGIYEQVISALIVIGMALTAHVSRRPYISAVLNRMETSGLLTSGATMYIGLIMFSSSVSIGAKQFYTIIIILINVGWFAFFIGYFFKRVSKGKVCDFNIYGNNNKKSNDIEGNTQVNVKHGSIHKNKRKEEELEGKNEIIVTNPLNRT